MCPEGLGIGTEKLSGTWDTAVREQAGWRVCRGPRTRNLYELSKLSVRNDLQYS